jgi:hypothetical protein
MAMATVRMAMEWIPALLPAVCQTLVRVGSRMGVGVLDAAVAVAVAFYPFVSEKALL